MRTVSYQKCKIDLGSRTEVRQLIEQYLKSADQHQIITLNPEYIVLAAQNPELAKLTQQSSLCVIDGVGLAFGLRRYKPFQRYPGADLVPDILNYCVAQGLRVGIVLSINGLSTPEQVHFHIQKHFPNLQFTAWLEGDDLIEKINTQQPTLLIVTFGQPRQEIWISNNLHRLSSVHVAIGAGGTIDFLTGARKRAPRLMQKLGVEWLWRLITQPKRLPRIFRATFGFWYTILFR